MSARPITLREVPVPARRAVGIVRVSRQDEDAVSPGEQRQRIEQACEREGLALVGIHSEPNVSGGADLERRPGLRLAVEMIEGGQADVLIGAYFDRLFRSIPVQREVVERVERAGGEVLTVDMGAVSENTAIKKMTGTFLGTVAEYHREVTAERTLEANRRNVERGVAPFPLPFFLKRGPGKVTVHHPRNVRLLREAIQMRLGGATIGEVHNFLRKRGAKVTYQGVQRAFGSRLLLGEIRFGDAVNERAFDEVIDPDTFRRLQRIRVPKGRRPKSDRLLARLAVLRCGSCGGLMQVGTSKGTYPMYKCSRSMPCEHRAGISAVKAERIVSDFTRERLEGMRGTASAEDDLGAAERELEKANADLAAAIRVLDGFDDEATARDRLVELRERRDEAEKRVDHLRRASGPAALIVDAYRDWDDISLEGKRDLIRAVIATATVRPGRGENRITITPRS